MVDLTTRGIWGIIANGHLIIDIIKEKKRIAISFS